MKPFSIKITMFIIVRAMGRCITFLVVLKYLFCIPRVRESSSVIASKQGLRQVTENGTQSARNEQASER